MGEGRGRVTRGYGHTNFSQRAGGMGKREEFLTEALTRAQRGGGEGEEFSHGGSEGDLEPRLAGMRGESFLELSV
jgi:hypothetical protein